MEPNRYTDEKIDRVLRIVENNEFNDRRRYRQFLRLQNVINAID